MESPGSLDAPATAVVVVPVKAFDRAKGRLAGRLDDAERAALARTLAEVVLGAAHPLPAAVVCDDEGVADWARAAGAAVVWAPGTDLNGSVSAAVGRLEGAGVGRAVVTHADLPFARGLAGLAAAGEDEVLLVADRHGDGTNVLSVPTGRGFRFHYGPGSCAAHRDEAARCGLEVRMIDDDHLAWDVDAPEDLDPPAELGPFPGVLR
ncbi:MAG: 2-phospho-L-lactate guanylyltransferase [Microthrixaceae bacterium]